MSFPLHCKTCPLCCTNYPCTPALIFPPPETSACLGWHAHRRRVVLWGWRFWWERDPSHRCRASAFEMPQFALNADRMVSCVLTIVPLLPQDTISSIWTRIWHHGSLLRTAMISSAIVTKRIFAVAGSYIGWAVKCFGVRRQYYFRGSSLWLFWSRFTRSRFFRIWR